MIYEHVLRNKLHQELVNAGIKVISVVALDDTNFGANITFAGDVDMDAVQQIIDAHNPTPPPLPLSEIDKIRLEQAQANAELVQLIMMMGGV